MVCMFTNQITNHIQGTYGVTACPHNNGQNNYYVVQSGKKCCEGSIRLTVTLYIYACSYEKALEIVSNLPNVHNFTIEQTNGIRDGEIGYYIVITPIYVDVDYSSNIDNGEALGYVVNLSDGVNTIDMVIGSPPKEPKSEG